MLKKQYAQSLLAYEQTERLYLLEKSKLQPSFTLSVTEFLLCEPDFMNDPEQATEAQFVLQCGLEIDERILRFTLNVSGGAEYLKPSFVVAQTETSKLDDRAFAMSETLYFLPVRSVSLPRMPDSFLAYFVYRDRTTMPVILKYHICREESSQLLRWEAHHQDTVFAMSHVNISALSNADDCAKLFQCRD
ncbi:hypothetical protein NBRC116583_18660 [Arenicella sp. 4NH20-0111]|uniref:hypothetical protein n=1 Tax=Arenicella sp. 4NH20-0111 TaxID=3127648 RepID=UPI00310BECA1